MARAFSWDKFWSLSYKVEQCWICIFIVFHYSVFVWMTPLWLFFSSLQVRCLFEDFVDGSCCGWHPGVGELARLTRLPAKCFQERRAYRIWRCGQRRWGALKREKRWMKWAWNEQVINAQWNCSSPNTNIYLMFKICLWLYAWRLLFEKWFGEFWKKPLGDGIVATLDHIALVTFGHFFTLSGTTL